MKKQILSYSDISAVCLELSLFIHAGADPSAALIMLAEETKAHSMKSALSEMAKKIDEGSPLSAAIKESGLFPDDVHKMLVIGEKTGRSEDVLRSLSAYYDHKDTADRELRAALLYPSILMAVMLSVIVVLLTKVLPIFSDVYASLGGQMTGVAGGLLRFGQVLDSVLPGICVFIGIVALIIIVFASSQGFRKIVSDAFDKMGQNNGIRKKTAAAKFAQALSMCLHSGLTPADALDIASELLPGTVQAEECKKMMENGLSLADALHESGLLPAAECRLLAIGFKSGNSEAVADEITRRLDKDAKEAVSRRTGMIEPAMVIITSVLIGLILLTVMLPLTHIMSSIG
ncbi:MAG: type II secretion system F family protein [Ruminococcaceae bacterium]|nr:type II secretion system F family protein [Oscillospiraceae bacterium]